MSFKNIAVIGGGGNLSPAVVNGLIQSPHGYNVSVISRESSTYKPPVGVEQLKTDYSHDSLVAVFKGKDVVISTVAGHAIPDQIRIVDAAIDAGVKRFVPSEFGSDTSNEVGLQLFTFWSQKDKVRKYLDSKKDQIEWTAFFNGFFFDWGIKVGFIPFNTATKTATIYPKYKDVTFSTTTLDMIGLAVAQALSPAHAPKTANKIVYVRSFTTTMSELLQNFEELTGEKWIIEEVDLDAAVKGAYEKLERGDPSEVGTIIWYANMDIRGGNDFDRAGKVMNDLLELPAQDMETVMKTLL
ncbi:NAD(P)-binding protein [Rhizodiscina lignyota]|uniref:NAD(P)-binding protein n=1 Tax=Rhizodiscina lignyota TaxID=1504668 RepID=A0A9P4I663_9PEZI|nr:NAD(P)-binding protein [Rhizodiscina lignyota]